VDKEKSLTKGIFPNHTTRTSAYYPDEFTEEEQLISKMVEQFVEEQVMPKIGAMEEHNYEVSLDLFKVSGELGLLGADVPSAHGGLDLGKKTSGLIAEKMGFGASYSVAFNIHTGVGTLPYVYFGTEEQKERYLSRLTSGEWVGAYALTEPNAGSDALSARTSANRTDTGWVLNGEKQWITNAHIANVYLVFARSEKGLTAFIVERSMDGVSLGPEEGKLGIAGSSTATLILDNVLVSNKNVLGVIDQGHHIAFNILNLARLKLAFANVGASKQALSEAIKYGKEREQFNEQIINFPIIREKVANIRIKIFAAESAAYYTAGLLDDLKQSIDQVENMVPNFINFAMDCSINKVYASETLDQAVDEALQIHGGYGYMQEYPVERMYRDARINRIFEGTNEINRVTIAKSFFKEYAKDNHVLKRYLVDGTEKFNQFTNASIKLLSIGLKALPVMDRRTIDEEQESLGLISDMLKDIYVLKASIDRVSKNKESIGKLIVEVLSEETFRSVETSTITILATVADSQKRESFLKTMKALSIPIYSNNIQKKREIVAELLN